MYISDLMRQYLQQMRHETGMRVCEKVILMTYPMTTTFTYPTYILEFLQKSSKILSLISFITLTLKLLAYNLNVVENLVISKI